MKYSVLMSVYRSEKAEYFRLAVDSMINQTVKPDEIVLVCDGPLTDELENVISFYKENYPEVFRIVRFEKNQGLGIALQKGLLACSNEIVARMDTDDIAVEDRMESQLAMLAADSDLSIVGGQIGEFEGSPDHVISYRQVPLTMEDIRIRCQTQNPMNHMTVTFRRQHVLDAGNYKHFDKFEDYYLWARMLKNGCRFANLDKVCVYARVDNGMYDRRAGLPYFKQLVRLEKYLFKNGFISHGQYWKNIMVRFVGIVLIPNSLRKFLYNIIMRKKSLSEK